MAEKYGKELNVCRKLSHNLPPIAKYALEWTINTNWMFILPETEKVAT